jgi:hypothetical protein
MTMWEVFKARMGNFGKSHTMMLNAGSIITTAAIAVLPNTRIEVWHLFTYIIIMGALNMVIRYSTTQDMADK